MLTTKKINLPYHPQKTAYYCGPAVLQMAFDYFKNHVQQDILARQAGTNADRGTDNKDLIRVATAHGFTVYENSHATFFEIRHFLEKGLPIIVNYIEPTDNEGHFALISGLNTRYIILNDPWNGQNFRLKRSDFLKRWHGSQNIYKEWIMVISKNTQSFGTIHQPK